MSAAVTEPKSLPSSPARASIRRDPAAISFEATASYSPFCLLSLAWWPRVSDSACFRAPFSALMARPRGIR